MKIVVTTSLSEAASLTKEGYCPVECSIGGESVVDQLTMDHHGLHSHLEGVAIRAYRDHYGVRQDDPRFVTALPGDADSLFAIAALAGILPAPGDQRLGAGVLSLAKVINDFDVDPIGRDKVGTREAQVLAVWHAVSGYVDGELPAVAGSVLWSNLVRAGRRIDAYCEAARADEQRRVSLAKADAGKCKLSANGVLLLLGTEVWGFDVWYGRKPMTSPHEPSSWEFPVVLARPAGEKNGITIGCPNVQVAEALFGTGGLKSVFPALDAATGKPGWGGRESVGGSPRGVAMSDEECVVAARAVIERLEGRTAKCDSACAAAW